MGSDLDIIRVGTWMLCGHGWGLIWTLSWLGTWMLCGHGWGLIWTLSGLAHGCSAGMDGV